MLTVIIGLAIALIIFYYYIILPIDYWRKRGVPFHKPIWFFGENFRNIMGLESLATTIGNIYKENSNKRYFGFFQFKKPTLLIMDPKLIKQITVKDFEHFVDHRSFVAEEVDPLWGKNLFELKGDKWKQMRPAVSPSFTSSKMKFLFGLMSECAENCVGYFIENTKNAIEFDVVDLMKRYANDTIASTAFGVTVDSTRHRDNEYYAMAKEATNFNASWAKLTFFSSLILPVQLIKLLGLRVYSKKASNFFRDIVNETIQLRKEKGIVRPDLIHILLEAQKNIIDGKSNHNESISNEDILAQSMIFLAAGFETLSTLLTFIFYEMALNKPVQDKLRSEIMETRNKTDRRITYESIMNMKYMDMVISESLRKYPVMSGIDRICTKPFVLEPSDPDETPLLIEKGVSLWLPVLSLHNDPKYFVEPERFDPERFNDENKDAIDPYSYIPFGVGPRNCIGSRFSILEMKVLVYNILLHFELFPTEKTQVPIRYRKDTMFIVPENGLFLEMRRLDRI